MDDTRWLDAEEQKTWRSFLTANRLLFDRNQVVDWAAARGLAAKAGFLAASRPPNLPARRLEPLLRAGGIWRDVSAAKVREVMEGIVAKHGLAPYTTERERTTWFKIKNRNYSQMEGREDLFERERHKEPVAGWHACDLACAER